MFATSEGMLSAAAANGYAIGAFNVENAEMVRGVVEAAEELRAPVIIQTTPGTLKYLPPAWFAALVRCAAEEVSVPVALHLDHGSSPELAEVCLAAGYSSLMIDGSALPLEENMAVTRQVCAKAKQKGVPVEGELGIIGGKEDDTQAEAASYTDPQLALRFVRETGVEALAIAVGTAHGFYEKTPVLNLEIARKTRSLLHTPLVLHGASGLADEVIAEAVRAGFSKVNFATDLRGAYTRAVRAYLLEHPDAYDPKGYGLAAREAVKLMVMEKIRICGSEGKAPAN